LSDWKISKKTKLLKIIALRIIIIPQGEITGHELNSPFYYLSTLASSVEGNLKEGSSSSFVRYGSSVSKEPFDIPVERFLASLRFEHRSKLDQLGIETGSFDTKIS
jgi:hypothetical protein